MALDSGTRLGPYEITGQIGAGGMGEVYSAVDTNLGRPVAIKVLPAAVAADSDQLARFRREAEILASLNHPNVAIVHGLEKSEQTTALVMELVEGPTLEERIASGPVPVDEALGIARQIVDALEAAHEQGIVHRDLKPGNIKLRPDGTIKVLDFGLAKALGAVRRAGNTAPTLVGDVETKVGVLMGTPAYMSPEQARGQTVDKRTDIWAFGCVLFELLAGRRPFDGGSATDTLAHVLNAEPDWSALPPAVSPSVRRLLKRCLERDPLRRLRDIGEARLVLDDLEGETELVDSRPTHARRPAARVTVAAAVLGVLVGVLGAWFAAGREHAAPTIVTRTSILLRDGQSFSFTGRRYLTISPDGTHIAYTADPGLWIRGLGDDRARPIAGSQPDPRSPFFSPDGQSLGYYASGYLWRVSLSGGAPTRIVEAEVPWSASWAEDGTILYAQGPDGIWRVPAAGGPGEQVIAVAAEESAHGPQLLPDGDGVLFTLLPAGAGSWDLARIVVQSLATGERQTLIDGGRDARYLSSGHLIYALNGDLLAARFDADARQVVGSAAQVLSGVSDAPAGTGAVQFDISATGTLVYSPQTTDGKNIDLVLVNRDGTEATVVSDATRAYAHPRLSPDGGRVVVAVEESDDTDVWIGDLTRRAFGPLTLAPGLDGNPIWTPDGTAVTVSSARGGGLFLHRADGSTPREQLVAGPAAIPSFWTRDGLLVYDKLQGPDIYLHDPAVVGGPRALRLVDDPDYYAPLHPVLSPDGRFVAYTSLESGEFEIYVRPFPDVAAWRRKISTDNGVAAVWSRDGSELYFMGSGIARQNIPVRQPEGYMMAVRIDTTAGFEASAPERLFRLRDYVSPSFLGRQYDVGPDGRFLMLKDVTPPGERISEQIRLVQNWFEELQGLVPDGR